MNKWLENVDIIAHKSIRPIWEIWVRYYRRCKECGKKESNEESHNDFTTTLARGEITDQKLARDIFNSYVNPRRFFRKRRR
jgi:hypothetical protein